MARRVILVVVSVVAVGVAGAGASCGNRCAGGEVYQDGTCVRPCNSAVDCTGLEACVAGACVAAGPPRDGGMTSSGGAAASSTASASAAAASSLASSAGTSPSSSSRSSSAAGAASSFSLSSSVVASSALASSAAAASSGPPSSASWPAPSSSAPSSSRPAPAALVIPPTELVEPAAWVESAVVPLGGTGVLRAVVVAGEGGPRFRVCPRVDCLTVTTDWTGSLSSVPDDQFIQLNGQAAFTANTLRSVAVNVDAATFTWDITTGIKVAFLAQVHSLADLGTYAFSGLTLGAATTGRMIAVAVHASTNVDVAFATAKLNATPCTKLVAVHENLANGTPGAMFLCDPGNAVTGAVEVSLSGGPPVRVGVALWSLVGLQGAAPHDVATYDGANPGSVVVDVAAGGAVLVGLSQNNAAGAVVTWGNAAEQYAWVMPEGTFTLMAGGYHYAPQGGTVTVTTDSSGAGTLNRLFPVSFR